jgi:hypothetical protein
MKNKNRSWRIAAAVCLTVTGLVGCTSIGSRSLGPDRLSYIQDISESWKKQMLLNIVKLRYFDPPTFLDVTSIINQYGMENQVSADMNWNWPMPLTSAREAGIGGYSRYSDKPTITYTPLSGQKFTKNLLTPIPPSAIVSLIQNGWPIDTIFFLTVKTVNGVGNTTVGGGSSDRDKAEFKQLVEALRVVQLAGVTDIRLDKINDQETVVMVISDTAAKDAYREQTETIRRILKIKPSVGIYSIVFGSIARSDTEIALQTRSMLEIMLEIGARADVPAKHVAEQRVNPTAPLSDGKWATQIHSSREKPKDAFTAIQYADHWFWIANTDICSKRNFALLMIFMSLTESEQKAGSPLFSISG